MAQTRAAFLADKLNQDNRFIMSPLMLIPLTAHHLTGSSMVDRIKAVIELEPKTKTGSIKRWQPGLSKMIISTIRDSIAKPAVHKTKELVHKCLFIGRNQLHTYPPAKHPKPANKSHVKRRLSLVLMST